MNRHINLTGEPPEALTVCKRSNRRWWSADSSSLPIGKFIYPTMKSALVPTLVFQTSSWCLPCHTQKNNTDFLAHLRCERLTIPIALQFDISIHSAVLFTSFLIYNIRTDQRVDDGLERTCAVYAVHMHAGRHRRQRDYRHGTNR